MTKLPYDIEKLADIVTEGVLVKNHPQHVILVQTRNTLYRFYVRGEHIVCKASKESGAKANYLSDEAEVKIVGSTFGGSAIKVGYIGLDMHLELFIVGQDKTITTTAVQSIRVAPLNGPMTMSDYMLKAALVGRMIDGEPEARGLESKRLATELLTATGGLIGLLGYYFGGNYDKIALSRSLGHPLFFILRLCDAFGLRPEGCLEASIKWQEEVSQQVEA